MLKCEETATPSSCLNKALDNERVFVLLARDAAAPLAIYGWVLHRVDTGLNKLSDPEIIEAMECARLMEGERDAIRKELGK